MKKREIITLMHKLFAYGIDTEDGYNHIFEDDSLSERKLNDMVNNYIKTDKALIYVNSQNAFECNKKDIYKMIKPYIKTESIHIATPCFKGKILTETTGVAAGSLTSDKAKRN